MFILRLILAASFFSFFCFIFLDSASAIYLKKVKQLTNFAHIC